MAKVNGLKDVDPVAITICKKGANRQQIFLRKSAADTPDALIQLPSRHGILKSSWDVFYCVVAEPGALEDPGLVGDPDSQDVWLNADEIRKAAHRLLKNDGYVNAMHDALAEQGCEIVENAVALADFEVDGTTIKKGSWYVAIEPSDEFKEKVDTGEITGVSMEGTGVRVELDPDAIDLLKTVSTFAEVIAERDFTDDLWKAWSVLEGVIWDAFRNEETATAKAIIKRSIAEFESYLLGKLDAVPLDERAGLAKEMCSLSDTTRFEESDMGLTDDIAALKKTVEEGQEATDKRVGSIEKSVEGLVEVAGKLAKAVEAGGTVKKTDEPEGDPTLKDVVKKLGTLADRLDEFDGDLKKIAGDVEALGEGDTGQPADEPKSVRKSSSPLAGLLD